MKTGRKPPITFARNQPITVAQFRDLLKRSTLAERRPVQDLRCLRGMLAHADLLVTAWSGLVLVGLARSVTDFHFCCYLSDLAVDRAFQRQGIGARLILHTCAALKKTCRLILLSAPAAVEFYRRIGMEQHPAAFLGSAAGTLRNRRAGAKRIRLSGGTRYNLSA